MNSVKNIEVPWIHPETSVVLFSFGCFIGFIGYPFEHPMPYCNTPPMFWGETPLFCPVSFKNHRHWKEISTRVGTIPQSRQPWKWCWTWSQSHQEVFAETSTRHVFWRRAVGMCRRHSFNGMAIRKRSTNLGQRIGSPMFLWTAGNQKFAVFSEKMPVNYLGSNSKPSNLGINEQ